MEADEFRAVLAAVRELVRKEVVPQEALIEERDEIPAALREKAAAMGLFGWALPEQYGGLGLSMSEDVRLAFELGYTTPAFRSMFGTNNGIAGQVLVRYGTEEQRARWLPRLASGEVVASFALTEAEAGSDPSGMTTRAVRDDDGYVINGTKRFITNAPIAGLFVVFARTDPAATGTKGISALLVEAGTPGLSVGPRDHKMGQSGAWTAEVSFQDVRVPASALVGGEEGTGFHAAMASLARGRLHIAAICVGMAERAIEEMVGYAATARQGGRPIGDHQLVQAHLAESHTEYLAGRALVLDAAARYDSGEDTKIGPSSAKLFCSEMVNRVTDRAVQVHGGSGYIRGVTAERLYRDARLFRIYEGTSEVQKLVIARQLLRDAR
ncbi:acyl-CoA dehydrogenase family protein [Amycolatopsis cynarae]|uniref:Acyl-CoA dehydrogenase family protein n=1 Tax=Amycolatopsis cynarae TaxID=2995223 RepID=A0ABY7B1M6_9PSEU|nr:acyl-CoA dehydrogenase family protein [Amycolatopsis sp. HUAS 11-8]WAL65864.1 acyl-CoA dehydrogenase family protein [Amycolatopsis sp. HUAS 11-8]